MHNYGEWGESMDLCFSQEHWSEQSLCTKLSDKVNNWKCESGIFLDKVHGKKGKAIQIKLFSIQMDFGTLCPFMF